MNLMKWIALLLFLRCFSYKGGGTLLSLEMGIAITPDRLVFLIILTLAVSRLLSGRLQFLGLGKVGGSMSLFALACTVSSIVSGRGLERNIVTGYETLTRLCDYIYIPFLLFLILSWIPHGPKNIEFLSFALLVLGAYLAINGAFEYLGLHALVWPKYILDPSVGIQFGRTRGSFASSEALGGALIITFLFYVLSTTRLKGGKLYWAYGMTLLTTAVIYTTNTRSVWLGLAFSLMVLVVVKSRMRRIAVAIVCVTCLGFFAGIASKFSATEGTLFSKRQDTVDYRLVNYMTTLEMGKANPIFGIGFGNFKTEWPKYVRQIPGIDYQELTDGNHNTYLGLFAEVGLVGLLAYLLVFYNMLRLGLRVFRRGVGLERDFALISLLVVGSYMIRAFFGDYRYAQFENTVLFVLVGIVAGIEARMGFPTGRLRTPVVSQVGRLSRSIAGEK